jgi:D-alanine-D-alanine ligase-like ATP-grasp enzyme
MKWRGLAVEGARVSVLTKVVVVTVGMAGRTLRIGVLTASHAESTGALKEVEDGYELTPAHFFPPRWPPTGHDGLTEVDSKSHRYTFEAIAVHKRTAYAQVRDAVKSGRFDAFFNLCDAAKDEDRAGVEVIQALEEFRVPFTGATSKHYEPSKDVMKRQLHYTGIRVPQGFVIKDPSKIAQRCASLAFPVIVKHVSGYSSVGMTKDSKCLDMPHLIRVATAFIEEYESVLVEEFIEGDEATVLACADPEAPFGIRVFPPVQMRFPEGEDFKHFHLKWNSFDDMAWSPMSAADPAYAKVMEVGLVAFKHIMDGVGYGRSDVRINRQTGEVFFLELNPNCGIMYEYGQEGSADWILRLAGANGSGHRDFISLQIRAAMERAEKLKPMFEVVPDDADAYALEAVRDIAKDTVIFEDEGRPTRLFTREYVSQHWDAKEQQLFCENAWPMGCDQHVYAVWDKDPTQWRPVSHSCDPNMRFVGGRSLNVAAARDIANGDRLTMDYRTFMDASMEPFQCQCGAENCAREIVLDQTPGFLQTEGKMIASFHRISPARISSPMLPEGAASDTDSATSGPVPQSPFAP